MNKTLLSMAVSLAFYSHDIASKTNEYHVDPLLGVQFEQGKIQDWENQLVSEKLDGIRAIWTGSTLQTRQGVRIFAPDWFTQDLPDFPVEGELWAGRGQFELVLSTVMDDVPDRDQWKSIQFMIFDFPTNMGDFSARYQALIDYVKSKNVPHIQYITHAQARNEQEVMSRLKKLVKAGGEGLILRDKKGVYHAGRDAGVVKLKITDDAEAKIIGYVAGKGKYKGQMGSLLVKMLNGLTFKIGTGFTDEQRRNPPEIGTTITYRYNGYTKNGIPKFARFWRIDTSK